MSITHRFSPQVLLSLYLRILLQPLRHRFFPLLTRYKLLYDDWRGYLIAGFALVWIANQYMSVYAHLRLDIRKDRIEIKHVEKQVEKVEEQKAA